MPLEAPAITLMVPVGAMQVRVEFSDGYIFPTGGVCAPLPGEFYGGFPGYPVDETHDLVGHVQRLWGLVGYAHFDEGVVPTHDAEANLAGLLHGVLHLLDGKVIYGYHVVEEAGGGAGGLR